jgi:hypothetical protein
VSVVLYDSETWSLKLCEEHRPRVFENRVLRRIFGLKRDKIIRGSRKLYNEEIHNLNSYPNVITVIKARRVRWVAHLGEMRNECRFLVEKPEGERPPKRLKIILG